MIAALRFGRTCEEQGSRVRRPAFVPRSTLPLQAACLVANGTREQLTRLLSREFEVELLEPRIPDADSRRVLFSGGVAYRVRGRFCDVFVVMRVRDAVRLAAAAFGESERGEAPLSEIERATLARVVSGMATLCAPLCGHIESIVPERIERAEREGMTYFEVRTLGEEPLAIGFALTRDPAEEVGERVSLERLLDIELTGDVECGRGTLSVGRLADCKPGELVPLRTGMDEPGTLRFGEVRFLRGTCGVRDGRRCFAVLGGERAEERS